MLVLAPTSCNEAIRLEWPGAVCFVISEAVSSRRFCVDHYRPERWMIGCFVWDMQSNISVLGDGVWEIVGKDG